MKLGNKMTIIKKCKMCKVDHTVEMTKDQFDRWESGEHIQDVAPQLTADEREILISGICGKCFDELFDIEYDDEEDEDL